MSSFANPHHIYLFAMKNGKKKLSWGTSPEDAFETLRLRLSERELAQVIPTEWQRFSHQREIHQHLRELG